MYTFKINKARIKAKLYKPTGDYLIEDKGDSYHIHLTFKDAVSNYFNLVKIGAEREEDSSIGAVYSVKKKQQH